MKKTLLLIVLFLVLNTACTKQAIVEPIEIKNDIQTAVNKELNELGTQKEMFFRVNNLRKDESIKIDLVKYDGLEKTVLVDSTPKKYNAFYIKIEDNKFSCVEIKDIEKGLVGDSYTYESLENLAAKNNTMSIYKWLDKKENFDKSVILFQKDFSNNNSVIFNNYNEDDFDESIEKDREQHIKDQFGYAIILSKVKDEEAKEN